MSQRLFLALLMVVACSGEKKDGSLSEISREPVSVRGWILDTKGAKHEQSPDVEIARRGQLFQSTSLWIEGSEYASGGIAENGAFIILDVPPGTTTIGFNAPGAEDARIVMKDVPGFADVFIPDVILEQGGATVLDPKKILIRLPSDVDKPRASGKTATIAGHTVPIIETPLSAMIDRRDYPNPGGFRPIAIVR